MKPLAAFLMVLVMSVGYQESARYRIVLANGHVLDRQRVDGLYRDSLRLAENRPVDIMAVERVEWISSNHGSGPSLLGIGCGALMGSAVGCSIGLATAERTGNWGPPPEALNGCLIGGVVGAIAATAAASADEPGEVVDLRGLSRAERRSELEQYFRRMNERRDPATE